MNVWKSWAESKGGVNDDIVKYEVKELDDGSRASLSKFAKAMALTTSRTA